MEENLSLEVVTKSQQSIHVFCDFLRQKLSDIFKKTLISKTFFFGSQIMHNNIHRNCSIEHSISE